VRVKRSSEMLEGECYVMAEPCWRVSVEMVEMETGEMRYLKNGRSLKSVNNLCAVRDNGEYISQQSS
jgi:hypothetical protein